VSETIDANLLLYASDETSPFHPQALGFLDQLIRAPGLVYLFWPTVMAYLRVATHPAIFARPLPTDIAIGNVEALLGLSNVQTTGEQDRFWQRYRGVAADGSVSGNLVPDAHLVALMLEHGVRTIWTNDRDFRRFDGIDVRDPFA